MDPTECSRANLVTSSLRSPRSGAKVVFLLGERHDAGRTARRLLGRPLRRWEYAGLAGAPDDARVEVGMLAGDLYLEMRHLQRGRYCAFFLVRATALGPVLVNDGIRIHPRIMRQRGLGLAILHRQLYWAKRLGIRRIEVTAGRGPIENGYYTWPRFGMDGPLPASVRRALPPGLKLARTVLDLIESEPGKRWWRAYGTTVDVGFDLSDGSRCWRVFHAYLAARQRQPG